MTTGQIKPIDVWERWEWLWNAIFYTAILLSAGFMLIDDNASVPKWAGILLTVFLILWHWGGTKWAYQRIDRWDENPGPRFVIIMVDIMLWFVLVSISLTYYFTLFGLFIQIFRHLPVRFGGAASLLLTVAMIFEQLNESGESFSVTNPNLWIFFFMGVAGILIGFWISAIIEQSTERRELISQLKATQSNLAASERREGILEERQRLTREIHDTLAQGFTSIIMHLEAADQSIQNSPDITTVKKHMDQARITARSSLSEARRVIRDLRPDLLDEGSLINAIERTTKRWREETGILTKTSTTGDPLPLHSTVEVTLLRATQEALNNIRKHAKATEVQVTLSYMGDLIMLDVQDNGVGLKAAEPSFLSGGYGLQAMRERVELCGGSVTLESDPGEGTTVVVTIPLSE